MWERGTAVDRIHGVGVADESERTLAAPRVPHCMPLS